MVSMVLNWFEKLKGIVDIDFFYYYVNVDSCIVIFEFILYIKNKCFKLY